MAVRTAPQILTVSLREDLHHRPRASLVVDRESGIIRRIKILGWDSANKRRYLPEAGRKALKLYDGAKAYGDHPDKPTQMRGSAEALGVWRNPVWEADGVYADLHFFKTHPLAERVCEDAERALGVFGASHNADGKGEYENGIFVVGEITEVRSVDLVTEPATVSNLWEGKIMKASVKTILLEKALSALAAGRAKRLKKLAEALPDTLEMNVVEGDHRDQMYGAMRACEEAGDSESAQKIHKLLAPKDVSDDDEGDGGDGEGDEGPVAEDGDEDEDDKAAEESRRPRKKVRGVSALSEARSLALCKAAGVEPTLEVTDALKGASLDQGLAIIALAKRNQTPAPVASTPRSAARGAAAVVESVAPRDSSGWAKRLLG